VCDYIYVGEEVQCITLSHRRNSCFTVPLLRLHLEQNWAYISTVNYNKFITMQAPFPTCKHGLNW